MDVRCEKCGTEYELDDSRLKPAGVSVKCTSCGHVFRVRRHPITSVGVGGGDPPRPGPRRPDTDRDMEPLLDEDEVEGRISDTIPIPTLIAGPTPGPRQVRMTPSNARLQARRSKERNWLVRLPGGTIETCRELATLHQWIIAGKVTRSSGISRTGKSWKKLGEIRELGPFFDVAEEMRHTRMAALSAPDASEADADAQAEAVLRARQVPRVIQPIPDSFSSSGPMDRAGSGDDEDSAWSEPETMVEEQPLAGMTPEPPVLPASAAGAAQDGARAALPGAAQDGAKRTLRGVPGRAPSAPAYAGAFTEEDEGPTEEVDVALALAAEMGLPPPPRPGRAAGGAAGPAVGEPASAAGGPSSAAGGDEPEFEDPSPSNPLDQKLPRPAELASAGASARPPSGSDATPEAKARPAGQAALAATLRGPAPVPMAPPGRAPTHNRSEGEEAAAERGGEQTTSAGPAARLHAAAQEDDVMARRLLEAGSGSDEHEGPRRLDRAGLARVAPGDEPQGPTAGVARRTAVEDVAFAGGKIRPLADDADDASDVRPATTSRAGRWIVVAALVLMAASAAVVYTFVFRPAGDTIDELALHADAGSEPGDGGAEAAPSAEETELAELWRTRLHADTRAGLETLDRRLAALDSDALLAARARVHTALAQHLFDQAELASDDARAGELDRKARALVLEALALAQRALQDDREDPDALVAMADVQRLQGRQGQQVESYLETALARAPEHREARLVRALLLAGSERTRKEARALLETLARSAQGDVRPAYRLALIDLDEARPEEARRRATEVLAMDPAHEGARALIAHLDTAPVVDTSDPMPVEEAPARDDKSEGKASGKDPGDKSSGDKSPGSSSGEGSGGSYRDLVAQADRKAKDGDCGQALELYERALDEDPTGVSALMGMAECHIQREEFASAYGKLQAVLAVAPSHAEAMWRMAEAYRKQKLNAQAVSWYRKYIEAHPAGARASKARQRIDELGGGQPGAGGGSGSEPPGGGASEPPGGGAGGAPAGPPPAGPPAGSNEPPAGPPAGSNEPPAGPPAGASEPPAGQGSPAPGDNAGDPPGGLER